MSILEIRPAVRAGARLFFVFGGWTGTGKTVSAILFGYGLAGYQASKLGLLDAENRRGSLCADVLRNASDHPTDEPFLIADLAPPFSPARYIQAIQEFEAAGIEALIVDSTSHEHEGIGGLIEIADGGPEHKTPNKYWNRAKGEHKKFMNVLMQSPMHIICCVRAREKSEPTLIEENGVTKKGYADLGLQPIIEKNFMFEATASIMLHDEGKRHDNIKVPGALQKYLGRKEGYITPADGFAVREWVEGGVKLDPVVEKFRGRLLTVAEKGLDYIKEAWSKTPEDIRGDLGLKFYAALEESARAFDLARQEGDAGPDDAPTERTATAQAVAAAAAAGNAAKKAEPKAEPKPEPKAEPKPEPKAEAKAEPQKAEPTRKPENKVTPIKGATIKDAAAPEPAKAAEAKPTGTPARVRRSLEEPNF